MLHLVWKVLCFRSDKIRPHPVANPTALGSHQNSEPLADFKALPGGPSRPHLHFWPLRRTDDPKTNRVHGEQKTQDPVKLPPAILPALATGPANPRNCFNS